MADKAAESVPTFLVMIDPAHGGSETGARIAPNLPEKELTLLLARKLRQELQSRHITTALLRDGDTEISLEKRAILVNQARPAVYVSLHAEPGSSLRLFTAALPHPPSGPLDLRGFLPWDTAQAAFSARSASLAAATQQALNKRSVISQLRPAFLNPLESVAAPAIAVEIPASKKGLEISPELIAGAIADAVVTNKERAGEQ
ncbi:MAG: N-acetylmuramoyl-L-alanine amidase [Acidobacteria bacterium]|nr:N-acetylmuramoyl-L-alanine amidase [Acidobacteriota bacterium]